MTKKLLIILLIIALLSIGGVLAYKYLMPKKTYSWIHNAQDRELTCNEICSYHGSKVAVDKCYGKDSDNEPKLCTLAKATYCSKDYFPTMKISKDFSTACCCEGSNFLECTSTDGNNPFVKGTTKGRHEADETDYCLDSNTVVDYKCDTWGQVTSINNLKCPNGCKEGACLRGFNLLTQKLADFSRKILNTLKGIPSKKEKLEGEEPKVEKPKREKPEVEKPIAERPKVEEEIEMSDSELSIKAVNDKDSSLCEKIKSEEIRDNCYRDLVIDARMGNPTFCQKIIDPSKKDTCYYYLASILNAIEYCRLISEQYQKDQCIKWVAIEKDNSDYCSEIKEKEEFKDDCYATIACNTENPDLCGKVKDEEKRAECEKYSRDPIITHWHIYDEQGRHTGPVGEIGKLKSEADFSKIQTEGEIPGTYIYGPAAGCSKGFVWIYTEAPLIYVAKAFDEGRTEITGSFYDAEKDITTVVVFDKKIYLKKNGRASFYSNPSRNPLFLMKVDTDGDEVTNLIQEPDLIKCTREEKEIECPLYGKDTDKDSYADLIDSQPNVWNPDQAEW